MTEQLYASYTEALAECGDGYEDRELARVLFDKTVIFPKHTYIAHTHEWLSPALFGLAYAARGKPVVNVIDFGGQYGLHQDVLKIIFPDIETRWAVVETPPFVENGNQIATADRRWFTTIASAQDWLGSTDLMFCSGVLQSMPDPAATLKEIVALRAPLILWQRMALTKASTAFTIVQVSQLSHNGPGPLPDGVQDREIRYPLTYYPETAFIDGHDGYQLVCRPSDHQISTISTHSVFHGAAFLFRSEKKTETKTKNSVLSALFARQPRLTSKA